jgi:hypothetical protein
MKFFSLILISRFLSLSWADLYDVQDTPELSHQLYSQYSKLHILLPKNDDPRFLTYFRKLLLKKPGCPTCYLQLSGRKLSLTLSSFSVIILTPSPIAFSMILISRTSFKTPPGSTEAD